MKGAEVTWSESDEWCLTKSVVTSHEPIRRDGEGGPGILSNDVRTMYGLTIAQITHMTKHEAAVCVMVSILETVKEECTQRRLWSHRT